MSTGIALSFPYTFLDRVLAEFILIPESKFKIVIHSIAPAIGVAFLAFMLFQPKPLSATIWLVVLMLFLFNPVLLIFGVAINYLSYKTAREPFTYHFDENGIHVSAVSHEFTHKWSAITKVKATKRYLLFFFAPGAAHCLPLTAIRKAGVFEMLLLLSREMGVKDVAP